MTDHAISQPVRGFAKIVNGIADTGFWLLWRNSRDMHHAWAMRVAEQVTEPLLTCEARARRNGVSN